MKRIIAYRLLVPLYQWAYNRHVSQHGHATTWLKCRHRACRAAHWADGQADRWGNPGDLGGLDSWAR